MKNVRRWSSTRIKYFSKNSRRIVTNSIKKFPISWFNFYLRTGNPILPGSPFSPGVPVSPGEPRGPLAPV